MEHVETHRGISPIVTIVKAILALPVIAVMFLLLAIKRRMD